jgi:hypothetical protein
VKEFKAAQLQIVEANMTCWLRPTKKHVKRWSNPKYYHPLDQTAVDHVRTLLSKSNEGQYPMLN